MSSSLGTNQKARNESKALGWIVGNPYLIALRQSLPLHETDPTSKASPPSRKQRPVVLASSTRTAQAGLVTVLWDPSSFVDYWRRGGLIWHERKRRFFFQAEDGIRDRRNVRSP